MEPGPPDHLPATPVTQAERGSVHLSCDLDVHLALADSREVVHADCVARNVSAAALTRIPMQLSSTLRWQSIALPLFATSTFTQSPVATDEDHTGYAQEAVLTLARPLPPGQTLTLSMVYSGPIRPASDRLQLLGAPRAKAEAQDWDGIVSATDAASTGLRGFGNVLWYPVAAPLAVLGQGKDVVQVREREVALQAGESASLHLAVDYLGDPPVAAIFCGEIRPLTILPDSRDEPVEQSRGLATVDFPNAARGASLPSLFLTAQQPILAEGGLLTILSPRSENATPYLAAAEALRPLLEQWLGPHPARPVILLDRPGEPFAEGALLAMPLEPAPEHNLLEKILLPSLTHAWAGHDPRSTPNGKWIEEGTAEFLRLLHVEQSQGRAAAIAQLQHQATLIALSEPAVLEAGMGGEPLIAARSSVYLSLKAASVLWQLREIAGDAALAKTLALYRRLRLDRAAGTTETTLFERTLEQASGKDLAWFFADWVDHDRGLPDLTIVQANPRPLPSRADKNSGYLVAVEVHNDGDAVAEVPVTVRSGSLSATERLRVPPRESASIRVLFEGRPDEVLVNDGSVPEQRTSEHILRLDHP